MCKNLVTEIKRTDSLKGHNLPKLTQGELGSLYILYYISQSVINNFPKQKASGLCGFTGEFYQTVKEEILSILYNLFQRTEAERILPNHSEANITLIPKLDKDITRKESYRTLSLMNTDIKILNKVLANQIPQ